ncbi:MAG TPA: helix-turn-helix domain-containing protein [Lutibacter sp.]|nr:helix-turn-helix domain-containing protein [Lutibacter sp.]
MTTETFHIKNMLCGCCQKLIKLEFENNGIDVILIRQGFVKISFDSAKITLEQIDSILKNNGMSLIKSRDQILVEEIKTAIVELIHYSNNIDSVVQKSVYLVEKLGLSYQQISKLFSKHEKITLERFVILNKIERIKELIDQDEYTLSEIAYIMDYSSVQYLSNQFKKETGMSVSTYKKSDKSIKRSLENLLNI